MADAENRAVVIGAGITGLSAAYFISKAAKLSGLDVLTTVLEASPRIGGKILTEKKDGNLFEAGPDSFIASKPEAAQLAAELGLSGELVSADPANRKLYVYSRGRLRLFPDVSAGGAPAAWAVLSSGLLSLGAKARLALEPFVAPGRNDEDESLGSFIRRRLGAEALDNLAGPLLAGLYAADADSLSLQSTFPELRRLESQGGLLRALLKPRSKKAGEPSQPARRASFMTLKGGLSLLTETLAGRLPAETVKTNAPVLSLRRRNNFWDVETAGGVISASAVICALPAPALAKLAGGFDAELAAALDSIPVETTATVSLAFPRSAFPSPLNAFGFLVVPKERGLVTAATYSSSKFPDRAAQGADVVRCFLVGKNGRKIEDLSEEELIAAAQAELRQIMGLAHVDPLSAHAHKWTAAIPQYTIGHEERLRRIDSCLKDHPGLLAAGCFYRGVGLPECIRQGKEAATKALELIFPLTPTLSQEGRGN